MRNPSINELMAAFAYEPETGVLFRRIGDRLVEKKLSISSNGYDRVGFKYVRYGAHRVAWALHHKEWPTQDIDHINGIRTDNRIANLRHVSRSTNLENIRGPKSHNASSGVLGVYVTSGGSITSRIGVGGKSIYLGAFKTVDDAHKAYMEAKKKYHKGFVNVTN